jgi:pyruvate,orthophosphate dikinase
MTQWVYDFAEGSRDMRELLGGKGANVAEMTRLLGAERVPAGFTITTEACVAYMNEGQEPEGMAEQVAEALQRLQAHAGKRLGDSADPLLVSVRSGARESMPGMLDTVLNLGLNGASVDGLARVTGNARFAWDSYRRFVQMFGNVSCGVPGERFEDVIAAAKAERGVELDTELDVDALRELTARFKALYDFPQDPREQLRLAIRAVFASWTGKRAVEYRRINRIPDDWGTAVNVQQMVFGNKGGTSGSGVAFSRDELTGAPEPSGDFLPNAQGEDVVSGVRTPRDLADMKQWLPEAHAHLLEILRTLEAHYRDMQDTEFTVEEGRLYMLQTRNAKRPAQAAVRFAVDAVHEGLLSKEEAIATIDPDRLDALLHPTFDGEATVLARGVAASPGAALGEIVFSAEDAVEAAREGRDAPAGGASRSPPTAYATRSRPAWSATTRATLPSSPTSSATPTSRRLAATPAPNSKTAAPLLTRSIADSVATTSREDQAGPRSSRALPVHLRIYCQITCARQPSRST